MDESLNSEPENCYVFEADEKNGGLEMKKVKTVNNYTISLEPIDIRKAKITKLTTTTRATKTLTFHSKLYNYKPCFAFNGIRSSDIGAHHN